MEANTSRRLHPVLEVLLIAAVIIVLGLATSWIINPFMVQLIRRAVWSVYFISLFRSIFGLFLGSILCFKVIEKRQIHWGTILLISSVYQLIIWGPTVLVNNFVARYGEQILVAYTKINAYGAPILAAAVMTLAVHILTAPKKEVSASDPTMQIGLAGHVLLLLFTCGIWNLIWVYRTTRYLNCTPDEPYRNPGTKLLLCLLIPFYSIYWVYQSAQRIDKLAKTVDVSSDMAVACLILEIFIPLIPPILMQDKINKIVAASQTRPEW